MVHSRPDGLINGHDFSVHPDKELQVELSYDDPFGFKGYMFMESKDLRLLAAYADAHRRAYWSWAKDNYEDETNYWIVLSTFLALEGWSVADLQERFGISIPEEYKGE